MECWIYQAAGCGANVHTKNKHRGANVHLQNKHWGANVHTKNKLCGANVRVAFSTGEQISIYTFFHWGTNVLGGKRLETNKIITTVPVVPN